jgi:hypothetical protein
MTNRFPEEVCQKLGNYVYRLIDPRNGETFYVVCALLDLRRASAHATVVLFQQ